ncbi:Serine-protein kinase ATM [Dirofilaria immitis]
MIPFQVIYYIAFLLLSIRGAEPIRTTKNASSDLITTGHSWQYGTNDESLYKFVNQFGLYLQKNETQIFRIMTYKTERWKDMMKSHIDVDAELIFWSKEQTITNIYKTCEEMNLAEFALLYHIVDATSNNLLIIDSDNEISDRISILIQIATKFNHCAQSAGKFSPIIYFCSTVLRNKLKRICHKSVLPLPSDLRYKNAVYSWMPRIFASATEYKYHNHFYHSTQQSRTTNKAYQDSRSQHVLNRHRRKHSVYSKKYKFLKLRREQKTMQKIPNEESDVLEVPIKRRKLLCKYRKSCYDTGIVPNTWNIHNILPTFMGLHEAQNNFSFQMRNENEEKEEISEGELKLVCHYRKSCYEEMGAKIEKNAQKVQAGFIFSRSITVLQGQKQKSIKEIASIALAKIEKKEKIAVLRPIPKKVITDKDLNKIEKKVTRRLACKYRKSCYDSGVRPEIDIQFNKLFQKIYYFLRQRIQETGIEKTVHKEFNNLKDDEKRIYCKYRKSCYITGKKPIINQRQVFKYMHIVKKQEEVIPLEIRCKYRKSCYETGILPELKKKIAKEILSVISMQTVTSLYQLKILCKYRKSCYKRKAEEQQNLNTEQLINATGQVDKAKTFDNDEAEQKKKDEGERKKIIKSSQKKSVLKSEKIEESKMECAFEAKSTKETNNKNFKLKKPKIFISEEKGMIATIGNKKVKEAINKSRKKKIKEAVEETRTELAMKVQKTILPTRIMNQPITENKAPEHAGFKKQRLKVEKKEKEIKKDIIKGKKIPVTEGFENKSLSFLSPLTATDMPSPPIRELQFISLRDENIMSLTETNIYNENLDPLAIKLLCKYRKSCYKNGKVPLTKVSKKAQNFQEKKEDHKPLEIRCKYRKSCYKTGKLLENFHENLRMTYSVKKKEESIPLTLKCKYRKSCYETGKLPLTEKSIFRFSTIQILDDYKKQFVEKEVNRKLRCKYRKSCYTSGILPSYLNHTVYVVATSIKQYEDPQLKCKHRKSCYENMELDIQLDKVRKKEEQKKMQEGVVKPPYQTEPVIKYKEKEQKDEVLEEVTNEKSRRTRKKKIKELKSEAEEQKYMQIKPLESRSRKVANKLRPLNSSQKLRCKYRLKCYNDISHQLAEEKKTEEKRQLSIKDFRRANGAICNIYYISCRKQAGLPILVRAPIGPNGRRLCRKKKKEDITN